MDGVKMLREEIVMKKGKKAISYLLIILILASIFAMSVSAQTVTATVYSTGISYTSYTNAYYKGYASGSCYSQSQGGATLAVRLHMADTEPDRIVAEITVAPQRSGSTATIDDSPLTASYRASGHKYNTGTWVNSPISANAFN